MSKLKRLSGADATIPNHRELATGTCQSIFRQATRYILESELFPYFYE
ncbi:type II toxin-antitoxin system HicA family toxin [Pseudanabaena yagii]|uniref:Type II toxin-antitoxin system HicA family toxin n=1 Tax=Pseudanabaena yagii GIHE-NHR1 TaxID=2722753 RepID=A0ABX1LR73_9CYAN|nr:type II toxin-antitoxin system HicA family toxin [Pseudanabaena yagii]NMF58000.1 type II toxin-antitoxin system HicA family toxin [Pseudanabaena yagii GIHE-NHR1]